METSKYQWCIADSQYMKHDEKGVKVSKTSLSNKTHDKNRRLEFGRLASGGASPGVLQQVSVPVVTDAKCKQAYGSSIHDSMVCAGLDQGGMDLCQEIQGGPWCVKTAESSFLEGVVSWGYGCHTDFQIVIRN
ncbi:hypothetical protein OS493_028300 [Desmophyllum pertusum]|uniref:Peptidase S1 domain-containing protein n=1 Tax=Desmophyllum pertusum TaxID=174260 RepID=A0A9X0CKV8_9CNID|nr:hypothetical protein OS493_028300 [Desmophyllum pertusum]